MSIVPAFFIACAVFFLAQTVLAGNSQHWLPAERIEQIVENVRAVMPGWTITASEAEVPEGWYGADARSVRIEAARGELRFKIWLVPKDWIAIGYNRATGKKASWGNILVGQEYKAIVESQDYSIKAALWGVLGTTAMLTNNGWTSSQNIFKGHIQEVDQQTQELVNNDCGDDAVCRDVAADSLIALGVPAREVTLECALRSPAPRYCLAMLGYWPGHDTIRILDKVLADSHAPAQAQKDAAVVLYSLNDPASGPALVRALDTVSYSEAKPYLIDALGRMRYEPAGSVLLGHLHREHDKSLAKSYMMALAGIHYLPAIPTIKGACATTAFSSDWFIADGPDWFTKAAETALMLLTAGWGRPSGGVRLLLLLPLHAEVGNSIQVTTMLQNVGDKAMPFYLNPSAASAELLVDGRKYPYPLYTQTQQEALDSGSLEFQDSLGPNAVRSNTIDLSPMITEAGIHHIRTHWGTAVSNELILEVKAPQKLSGIVGAATE